MKEKAYIDTSIPSAYFDNREENRRIITQKWWKGILFDRYDVYISELVEAELGDTKDIKKRKELLELVKGIKVLEINSEAEMLSHMYVKNDIISEEYIDDARHLAIATLNNIGLVISWNFNHLVNHDTKMKVKAINLLHGYREIEIESPLELGGGEYA